MRMKYAVRIGVGLVLAMCLSSFASAQVLITPAEAALPPAKGAVAVATRGISRGPKAEFIQPGESARSPTIFNVKFESYGGASIDLNTVKVTYLRSPSVDLTTRVKPFLQPNGIMMPSAELPPGDHLFRIDLMDSGGRAGTTNFVLKIAP